jgi:hypothetical protein
MAEPQKITIIEGPPPTFEMATETWLYGLVEGSVPAQVALCRLRTFNGAALVERCFRAWRDRQGVTLEYRGEDGSTQQAAIVAARWTEVDEGQLLTLWVRLELSEAEIELEVDDDSEEDPGDLDLEA